MLSFQHALATNEIHLQRGKLDCDIFVFCDQANDSPRFTYVSLDGGDVIAFVNLILVDPIDDGIVCFQIGYAVSEKYRNQGYAKAAIKSALAELWSGLSQNGIPSLCIEAVVHIDNHASNAVARTTLSDRPTEVTDCVSGLQALHYVLRIQK